MPLVVFFPLLVGGFGAGVLTGATLKKWFYLAAIGGAVYVVYRVNKGAK